MFLVETVSVNDKWWGRIVGEWSVWSAWSATGVTTAAQLGPLAETETMSLALSDEQTTWHALLCIALSLSLSLSSISTYLPLPLQRKIQFYRLTTKKEFRVRSCSTVRHRTHRSMQNEKSMREIYIYLRDSSQMVWGHLFYRELNKSFPIISFMYKVVGWLSRSYPVSLTQIVFRGQ